MSGNDAAENFPVGYVPSAVWTWDKKNGGPFANINRPISGATHDKELPRGPHPMQLHSLGSPNGVKVTIMLEELLALGYSGAEYDAWFIDIGAGEQFGSGFVSINPNSKIPALLDCSFDPPIPVFESGAMLFYLAEKFGEFLPEEPRQRAATQSWVMWQMASAPFLGGGFGHFYAYAPMKIEYAINRYTMEAKRHFHLLDTHLARNEYMAGDTYTIADMAILPWYGLAMRDDAYKACEFLGFDDYRNLARWIDQLLERPAVRRGRMVNRGVGDPALRLRERHEASDFDTNTDDKVEARGGRI